MYERTFQQGSYVIRQGEPGNHIFVLKGGYCLLVQHTSARNRKGVWKVLQEITVRVFVLPSNLSLWRAVQVLPMTFMKE